MEREIVKICDDYKGKLIGKKQVILELRQIIYNYEQKFMTDEDRQKQPTNKQKWKKIKNMFENNEHKKLSLTKSNISIDDLTITDFKLFKLNSETQQKLSEWIHKAKY